MSWLHYFRGLLHFRRQLPTLPSQQAYRLWAEHYPAVAHNAFMALEQRVLEEMLPPLEGRTVLDLACGSGRWGKVAAGRAAQRVISIDNSLAMLLKGGPARAIQGSMAAIPLPRGTVDVLLCGLAVGHAVASDWQAALAEMRRVLVPGGVILISDLHPAQVWLGARRTFRSGGQVYAVEHHIHLPADYVAAARRLDLELVDLREVSAQDGRPPVLLAVCLRQT